MRSVRSGAQGQAFLRNRKERKPEIELQRAKTPRETASRLPAHPRPPESQGVIPDPTHKRL